MRELGVISGERQARRFADHLLAQRISTKLVASKDGKWVIWVHDENRVNEANEELQVFLNRPDDPRFTESKAAADEVRRQAEADERLYRKNARNLIDRWEGSAWNRYPLTLAIIIACIAIAVYTNFGASGIRLIRVLAFSDWTVDANGRPVSSGLDGIRHGQVWRLVTPILLHFGIFHLVFNLSFLRTLGGLVESRKGSLRFGAFVLATAIISNSAQFLANDESPGIQLFGGMSGVAYAIFGYLWVKGFRHPEEGLGVSQQTVVIMMAWFFLCMTGTLGPIANTAHGAGLVAGMVIGLTKY